MHKMLIVDDDVIIREGLAANVSWEEHGIQLVGTASDGETALELIERLEPNLIVSDIKMPFMDGIELARSVLSRYPDTRFILLTGYDEFEYAKAAVDLKVDEFLLKPVAGRELVQTVRRAAWAYDNDQRARKQLLESRALMVERLAYRIVHGQLPVAEIRDEADFLGVQLEAHAYVCLVARMDEPRPRLGLLNIVTDLVNENQHEGIRYCLCTDSGIDEVTMLFGLSATEDRLVHQVLSDTADSVRHRTRDLLRTTVSIGIGASCSDLARAPASYQQARTAAEFRHTMGIDQVFFFQDTGLPQADHLVDIHAMDREILNQIRVGLSDEVIATIETLKSAFQQNNVATVSYIRFFAMEKIMLLFREFEGYDREENGGDDPGYYRLFRRIQSMDTIDEIFGCVVDVATDICTTILQQRQTRQKRIVETAMAVMRRRYGDDDLGLGTVASEVGVSASYLSMLFKHVENINFSDYLLSLRMGRAVELLQSTDMLIYEVAEKTGYSNSQYFSLCFRKHAGVSPSDFRTGRGGRHQYNQHKRR